MHQFTPDALDWQIVAIEAKNNRLDPHVEELLKAEFDQEDEPEPPVLARFGNS